MVSSSREAALVGGVLGAAAALFASPLAAFRVDNHAASAPIGGVSAIRNGSMHKKCTVATSRTSAEPDGTEHQSTSGPAGSDQRWGNVAFRRFADASAGSNGEFHNRITVIT